MNGLKHPYARPHIKKVFPFVCFYCIACFLFFFWLTGMSQNPDLTPSRLQKANDDEYDAYSTDLFNEPNYFIPVIENAREARTIPNTQVSFSKAGKGKDNTRPTQLPNVFLGRTSGVPRSAKVMDENQRTQLPKVFLERTSGLHRSWEVKEYKQHTQLPKVFGGPTSGLQRSGKVKDDIRHTQLPVVFRKRTSGLQRSGEVTSDVQVMQSNQSNRIHISHRRITGTKRLHDNNLTKLRMNCVLVDLRNSSLRKNSSFMEDSDTKVVIHNGVCSQCGLALRLTLFSGYGTSDCLQWNGFIRVIYAQTRDCLKKYTRALMTQYLMETLYANHTQLVLMMSFPITSSALDPHIFDRLSNCFPKQNLSRRFIFSHIKDTTIHTLKYISISKNPRIKPKSTATYLNDLTFLYLGNCLLYENTEHADIIPWDKIECFLNEKDTLKTSTGALRNVSKVLFRKEVLCDLNRNLLHDLKHRNAIQSRMPSLGTSFISRVHEYIQEKGVGIKVDNLTALVAEELDGRVATLLQRFQVS